MFDRLSLKKLNISKKYFVLVTILVISIFLTSCGNNYDLEHSVKKDMHQFYDDINAVIKSDNTREQTVKGVKEIIENANIGKIKIVDENLIIDIKSEGKAKYKYVLQCDFGNSKTISGDELAIALSTAKNLQKNSEIRLILSYKDSLNSAVEKLDKSYFEGYRVLSLVNTSKNRFYTSSMGTTEYKLTYDMKKSRPAGNTAYSVEISGLSAFDSAIRSKKDINPITFVGNMLSDLNSAGVNIEIAEFESDGEINNFANKVKLVFVGDKSVKEKVERKLEREKKDFTERKDNNSNAKFTYSEVSVPDLVYDYNQTAKILSVLYTLVDGVYATSEEDFEGDITGVTAISRISSSGGISVGVMGRYATKDIKTKLDRDIKAVAVLSDFTINTTERKSIWKMDDKTNADQNKALFSLLEKAGFEQESGSMLLESSAPQIAPKIKNNLFVPISVEITNGESIVVNILNMIGEQ